MEFAFLVFEPAFLVLEPDMEQTPSVLVLTSSFLQHLRKHDRGSWPSISTNCSTHRLSLSISRVRVMATYKMFSSSYQYGRRALLRGRPAVVGTPVSGLLQKSVDSCRGLWTPAVVGTPVSGLHCGLLMMMNAFHNHINPFLCSIIVIGSESFKKAL